MLDGRRVFATFGSIQPTGRFVSVLPVTQSRSRPILTRWQATWRRLAAFGSARGRGRKDESLRPLLLIAEALNPGGMEFQLLTLGAMHAKAGGRVIFAAGPGSLEGQARKIGHLELISWKQEKSYESAQQIAASLSPGTVSVLQISPSVMHLFPLLMIRGYLHLCCHNRPIHLNHGYIHSWWRSSVRWCQRCTRRGGSASPPQAVSTPSVMPNILGCRRVRSRLGFPRLNSILRTITSRLGPCARWP